MTSVTLPEEIYLALVAAISELRQYNETLRIQINMANKENTAVHEENLALEAKLNKTFNDYEKSQKEKQAIREEVRHEFCQECYQKGVDVGVEFRLSAAKKRLAPKYECNCEDLRTCKSLYGNKHGAVDKLKKRKAAGK